MLKGWMLAGIVGLAVLLGGVPTAGAYSLGEIQVISRLGEPFLARIPLRLRDGEDPKKINVGSALPREYEAMELDRSDSVGSMRFMVIEGRDGAYIEITGQNPIAQPFFNLLLATKSGLGSQFRNYTVFLEIPTSPPAVPAVTPPTAAPSPPPAAFPTPPPMKKAAPVVRTPPAPPRAVFPPSRKMGWPSRYGPVKAGESLSIVAQKLAKDRDDLSITKIMVAVWTANKEKFKEGYMDSLPRDVELEIPPLSEVNSRTLEEAIEIRRSQRKAWLDWAGPGPDVDRARQPKPVPAPIAAPGPAPAEEMALMETSAAEAAAEQAAEPEAAEPEAAEQEAAEQAAAEQAAAEQEAAEQAAAEQEAAEQEAAEQAAAEQAAAEAAEEAMAEVTDAAPVPAAVPPVQPTGEEQQEIEALKQALEKSDAQRKRLTSNIVGLMQRTQKLEQDRAAGSGLFLSFDHLIYGGGAALALLLVGILSLVRQRRKREAEMAKVKETLLMLAPVLAPALAAAAKEGTVPADNTFLTGLVEAAPLDGDAETVEPEEAVIVTEVEPEEVPEAVESMEVEIPAARESVMTETVAPSEELPKMEVPENVAVEEEPVAEPVDVPEATEAVEPEEQPATVQPEEGEVDLDADGREEIDLDAEEREEIDLDAGAHEEIDLDAEGREEIDLDVGGPEEIALERHSPEEIDLDGAGAVKAPPPPAMDIHVAEAHDLDDAGPEEIDFAIPGAEVAEIAEEPEPAPVEDDLVLELPEIDLPEGVDAAEPPQPEPPEPAPASLGSAPPPDEMTLEWESAPAEEAASEATPTEKKAPPEEAWAGRSLELSLDDGADDAEPSKP